MLATDGKVPFKSSGCRGVKSSWSKRQDSVPTILLQESVRTRHVIIGTLPCVKNYMSESGCTFGEKVQIPTR